jgi:uncharacterized protein
MLPYIWFAFAVFIALYTDSSSAINCQKANNFSERSVCNDEFLLKYDALLNLIYKNEINSKQDDSYRQDFIKDQKKWIEERNACKTKKCVRKFYSDRLDNLCYKKKTKSDNFSVCIERSHIRDQEWLIDMNKALADEENVCRVHYEQYLINCNNINSYSDKTICNDKELLELDSAVSKAYESMFHSEIGECAREVLKHENDQWISERKKCQNKQCIIDSYKNRYSEICDLPVVIGVHPLCNYLENY